MAVGAMSMFRKRTDLQESNISTKVHVADPRYLQALGYYGQALQLQSQRASFQSSAFLSLILLIFESLRLRKLAALDHINHGMALLLSVLDDLTTSSNEIASFSPNPRPILGQLADIFMHLATQTRIVLKDLAKGLRERGILMEDFIVLLSEVPTRKNYITPEKFRSLDEFEEHWISMTRRQAEMSPIMLQAMMRSRILETEDQQQIGGLFASILSDANVQSFCDNTRLVMESMEQAFLPLFSDIMMSTTMDSPTYLRAVYLRLRFLSVHVFSNPPQYACVQSMVALTPRLREFLSLAELAIRITRKTTMCPAYSLCIDGGLAWYLLQIALHCRDPLLRDEAILALEGYAGQDGLWTTRSLHALALRNRIVEQRNVNGDPAQAQWQRLWRREYYLEDGGERVIFRFLEKHPESDQWVLVEEVGEFEDQGVNAKWTRQPNPQSGRLLVQDGFPHSK
ncbi:unnamed protein product [Clonostachys rosea]|uniref:Uncharacterized protein n=1 Tax=Bionectria ochroleuca TaxID=29856 RepID=A0ABY6UJM1_BIOOC|nr:unnamed protein product [Clonostachys rosea]